MLTDNSRAFNQHRFGHTSSTEAWLAAMLAEGMGVKSAAAVVTARLGGRKKQWYQCAQALKDRDA